MSKRAFFLLIAMLLVCYSVHGQVSAMNHPQVLERGQLSVWHDESGDLWVSSPDYTWNITSGEAIFLQGGTQMVINPTERNLIETFFLEKVTQADLTTRIIFSLPKEAAVYIGRNSPEKPDSLEIHFRAEDGLITLIHRGEKEVPERNSLAGPKLTLKGVTKIKTEQGNLPMSSNGPMWTSVGFWNLFGEDEGYGVAAILPESDQPLVSGIASVCNGAIVNRYFDACSMEKYALGPNVISKEYLLIYHTTSTEGSDELVLKAAGQLQLSLPDLDAGYIERQPRYDYDATKNLPKAGDTVTFIAHISNRGGTISGNFGYEWQIDGTLASSGTHTSLVAGESGDLSLDWTWQEGAHTISIQLDSSGAITEVTEQNNLVTDRTNAISIGFWAEQSVIDYFNAHQVELGLGSNSLEDYLQRQVRVWNQIFEDSVNPLTPYGVSERVRLDQLTIVPDGTLPNPYPSNFPDTSDKTIDLEWGVPSEMVGVPSTHPQYGAGYLDYPDGQVVDYALMHELSHARYLDDLYAINVAVDITHLNTAVGPTDTTLVITGTAGSSPFTVPAYLAIERELVICQNGSGNTFTNCQRGAEGTTPRSHALGAVVNRAGIRLQDGMGNLVLGGPAMPLLGYDDHVYYNRYIYDMMNGGRIYQQHSAYALERIAGQRALCGNYNSPCNLGDYQDAAPIHNIFTIANGKSPIVGATVDVYRAISDWNNGYNVELFLTTPEATLTTDSLGQVDLGHFPFDPYSETAASYNRAILLRVTKDANVSFHFVEVTLFNEAYWAGWTDTAWYYLDTTTSQVDLWVKPESQTASPGDIVTLDVVVGNYGATNAADVSITAQFDPSLEYVSAYPAPATHGSGFVTWAYPDLYTQQVGLIQLQLIIPEEFAPITTEVQWQIQSASEAFPSDNISISTIDIFKNIYLPSVAQNYLSLYTLQVIGLPEDAEVGRVDCITWSGCRNAVNANFILNGYEAGTVDATKFEGKYGVKRIFLYFDLAGLPAGVEIESATLNVYSGMWQGGNTILHVVRTTAGRPVSSSDFSKITFVSGGSANFPVSSWVSIPLNGTALGWLVPGQVSKLALINELDLNNITPTISNNVLVHLNESGTEQPYLEIKYYR